MKAGGTGPRNSDRSVVFITDRVDDECKAIRANHDLDCGIFLDGKVDNMVQITLAKLVPAQSCICGFEFIQRVQFL